MDPVSITIGLSWTIVGVILIGLSIPLIRGAVRRNPIYGVRLPQSFQSDDAWFAINRFGGRRLAVWAIPLVVVGVVSFFLPLQSHTALTLTLGFAPLVFLFIPLVEVLRFARHYDSGEKGKTDNGR